MESKTNSHLIAVISIALSLICFITRGQFFDCSSGLLQTPTAEMNQSGTFMFTTNYLNKHTLPSSIYWDYNTFNYGINITFWSRLEIGYVMTLIDGSKKQGEVSEWYRIMKTKTDIFLPKCYCLRRESLG